MNKKKQAHPVFKPEYNIQKRVKADEKMRNFHEYSEA